MFIVVIKMVKESTTLRVVKNKEYMQTLNQFISANPHKYIIVTYEFGDPIYIAPLKDLRIQVTPNKAEAETWTELDNTPIKLDYHKVVTGYNQLIFEILPA